MERRLRTEAHAGLYERVLALPMVAPGHRGEGQRRGRAVGVAERCAEGRDRRRRATGGPEGGAARLAGAPKEEPGTMDASAERTPHEAVRRGQTGGSP